MDSVETFAQRVKRAGADVAIDHAQGPEHQTQLIPAIRSAHGFSLGLDPVCIPAGGLTSSLSAGQSLQLPVCSPEGLFFICGRG
jgi:hypothetical protein